MARLRQALDAYRPTVVYALKDHSGITVGTADSGTFEVFYTTVAGTLVNRYRLYNPITLEHLFTTDLNEYNVLGGEMGVWLQEGPASQIGMGDGIDRGHALRARSAAGRASERLGRPFVGHQNRSGGIECLLLGRMERPASAAL